MPLRDPERTTRRFIRQVARLAHSILVPVLLENTEPLPFDGYDFEVWTERITEVLERAGCGFLLDTGHARVSAAALRMDVYDDVRGLPLGRVMQIHISRPQVTRG